MNAPLPLSVTLSMSDEIRATLARDEGAVQEAQAYVIDASEVADLAKEELDGVKARARRLKELKDGFVAPAKQILENAASLFNPALESLARAEAVLKSALLAWNNDQEQKRIDAKRKADAEERERRQKAEQEAAAAHARAAEQAREQERAAAEAEQKRQEAQASGDAKAAAKFAAAAAKAAEAAVAAIENGNAKAADVLVAATAGAPATIVPEVAKVAGLSFRDNWKAEFLPNTSEDDALKLIVAAAATTRPDLLALLRLDTPSADRLAKAQKSLMSVPGLHAVNRPIAASRSR